MTLKELKNAVSAGEKVTAQVLAADPMVYLLQVLISDGHTAGAQRSSQLTLQNARGENLVYRSRYAADQAFARAGLSSVTLVHESAFGEMVGLEAGPNRMEQTYPVKLDNE